MEHRYRVGDVVTPVRITTYRGNPLRAHRRMFGKQYVVAALAYASDVNRVEKPAIYLAGVEDYVWLEEEVEPARKSILRKLYVSGGD